MYISVLILWGWNRVVSLYTEVSLFQGVGIKGFYSNQFTHSYYLSSTTDFKSVSLNNSSNPGFNYLAGSNNERSLDTREKEREREGFYEWLCPI